MNNYMHMYYTYVQMMYRYQQTLHTTYISVTELMLTKPTYHLHMYDRFYISTAD